MKKVIIALLMIMATTDMNSQTKFSVEAGPQYSPDFSWRIGGNADIPISSRLSVVPGLYLSNRHRVTKENYSYEEGETRHTYSKESSFHANYITLPLRLGIRIGRLNAVNSKWQILVGPYIAYGTNGSGTMTKIENGIRSQTKYSPFEINGMVTSRWDYGFDSEIQYTYKNKIKLGAFMESGFKKLYQSDNDLGKVLDELFKVNTINISAGIIVGYQF
ncbi:outer membrane beta-barrel protein [Prevotella sp.]|uniref:outer membrane beta-barrel protein n=1 Tax=Prevotella sp. TaxID=59823 RepID=UPI0026485B54|nr:outer membrane beta-barrel protein [Prevotella sp.]MDN5553839.1 PorT family protein [Prevotella sp.]